MLVLNCVYAGVACDNQPFQTFQFLLKKMKEDDESEYEIRLAKEDGKTVGLTRLLGAHSVAL